MHSAHASADESRTNSTHVFVESARLSAVERAAVLDVDITPFRGSRRKRYNTLDLAGKVVRQRRARPSLGTLLNTGKSVMTLCKSAVFAGIPFRPFFQKLKK